MLLSGCSIFKKPHGRPQDIYLEPGRMPQETPIRRVYKSPLWHSNYSLPSPSCLHSIDKGYCSFSMSGYKSLNQKNLKPKGSPFSANRLALIMGTKKLRRPNVTDLGLGPEFPKLFPSEGCLFPHVNGGSKRAFLKLAVEIPIRQVR